MLCGVCVFFVCVGWGGGGGVVLNLKNRAFLVFMETSCWGTGLSHFTDRLLQIEDEKKLNFCYQGGGGGGGRDKLEKTALLPFDR